MEFIIGAKFKSGLFVYFSTANMQFFNIKSSRLVASCRGINQLGFAFMTSQ